MEPLIKKIGLNPAKVGEKMQLSNVFYEVDSWQLKKESMQEFNNLAEPAFQQHKSNCGRNRAVTLILRALMNTILHYLKNAPFRSSAIL